MRRRLTDSLPRAFMVCALAILFPAGAHAIGRFDVTPVVITFEPGQNSASVEITNTGPAAQELEIAMRSWSGSAGNDEGDPTDDIIASPSIFIVEPGKTQLVRLGPARDLTANVERTYRLVATEVPAAAARDRMQTLLRMRFPVFIAPRTAETPPLVWTAARADAGHVVVRTRNDGNLHRRIRALRITSDGRVLFDGVVAAYVLARETREWSVPLKAGAAPVPLDVRETEMDGSAQETTLSVR